MSWIIYALLAAFLTAFSDFFKKKILEKEHTAEFLTVFNMSNLLILLPFLPFIQFHFSSIVWSGVIFRSILIVLASICLMKAMKHLPLSTVSPLTNFKSLFVLIAGIAFLHESLSLTQLIGIFVVVIGGYILDSQGHLKNWHKPLYDLFHSKYIQFILFFGIFVSLSSVLAKVLLTIMSPLTLLFFIVLFILIIYLLITFIFYKGFKDIKYAIKNGKFWFILMSILEMGSAFFFFKAFTEPGAKVVLIVPFVQVSTLIEIFLGGKALHEKHILIKIVAGIFMILGVAMIVI